VACIVLFACLVVQTRFDTAPFLLKAKTFMVEQVERQCGNTSSSMHTRDSECGMQSASVQLSDWLWWGCLGHRSSEHRLRAKSVSPGLAPCGVSAQPRLRASFDHWGGRHGFLSPACCAQMDQNYSNLKRHEAEEKKRCLNDIVLVCVSEAAAGQCVTMGRGPAGEVCDDIVGRQQKRVDAKKQLRDSELHSTARSFTFTAVT
jgi:hypothetical protein